MVEPKSFGANSQTCHKALTATILILPPQRVHTSYPRRTKFGRRTSKKQNKIIYDVSNQIMTLHSNGSTYDYSLLKKMFFSAKLKILGKRVEKRSVPPLTNEMRRLQGRFSDAITKMEKEKSRQSVFIVENLEKLLKSRYKFEQDTKFSTWLRKMNDLDFHNRTRTFFRRSVISRE